MKFTKLHGCGNGYIYVNLFEETLENPAEMAIKVSDHHFGIGSDGLITIGPSEIADFTMHIYNADGSEAEMCGNGVRCVGKYVYDHGLTDKTEVAVENYAGLAGLSMNMIVMYYDAEGQFISCQIGEEFDLAQGINYDALDVTPVQGAASAKFAVWSGALGAFPITTVESITLN